jgi:hypothetical protein
MYSRTDSGGKGRVSRPASAVKHSLLATSGIAQYRGIAQYQSCLRPSAPLLVITVENRGIDMNSWDSMDSWSNYSNRPPTTLEDVIYQHLQYWRQHEPPHKLIERFRQLFLEVQHYPDSAVASALIKLMQRPNADRELKYVLNRCCYTLINPWYSEPRNHWAIPALVDVLDERPGAAGGSPEVQQIQALIQDFVTSDQYAALNRLRQIFTPPTDNTDGADPLTAVSEQPLAHRIRYYPFLYDTSLLTKDSGQEQKKKYHPPASSD